MSLIESYVIEENGFHPFLIRDSWQVGKLNYKDAYHINNLDSLRMHRKTDRAFALLHGSAVLIAFDNDDKKPCFKAVLMQRGTSYNIPKNIRYTIAMEEESEVFVVEKPNTQIDDVEYYYLNEEQLKKIRLKVNNEYKKKHE